jgi:hypothetical protein
MREFAAAGGEMIIQGVLHPKNPSILQPFVSNSIPKQTAFYNQTSI